MSDINIMSFNVRNPCDKGTESWESRFERLVPLVKNANPDLIGFQETVHRQYMDLADNFPEYGHVGVGRDDGASAGEYAAIFYRNSRFERMATDSFWLSETPSVPSRGWDAACIRICTYVKFRDKFNGREFYHFNTHLDHVGQTAMLEGAKLIIGAVSEKNSPSIVTGDFNSYEHSPPYAALTHSEVLLDSKFTAKSSMSHGTCHGYNPSDKTITESPIDYIFHTNDFSVNSYKVLINGEPGQFTSDHYPVIANLTWRK